MRSLYFAAFAGSLAILYAAAPPASSDPAAVYKQSVQPVLAKNCYGCHNMQLKTANLDLPSLKDADSALQQNTVWEDVKDRLAKGTMPPKGMPRPAAGEVSDVTAWIESLL